MVFYDWFPYEPRPVVPTMNPYKVYFPREQINKIYYFCACGLSKSQPFCDGSHKTTKIKPIMYDPQYYGNKLMCGCKWGSARPLCNGECVMVQAYHKLPRTTAMMFGSCFFLSMGATWMFSA